MTPQSGLLVVETHPVQYHAPVYRELQQNFGVPVSVIYGSDFSLGGYQDSEFNTSFAWDTDLLSGYGSTFLGRAAEDGARSFEEAGEADLGPALRGLRPRAVLCLGYKQRLYREAMRQARQMNVPMLFRAETTDHAVTRPPLKRWLRDRLLRRLYRGCDRLLYIGERSLQHYQRLGCSAEKLVFSPYCVDTTPWQIDDTCRAQLREATRHELGISTPNRVVLAAGKLVPRKGPDLLLRAVKQLPAVERDRTDVLFLGDGPMRDELTALARVAPAVRCHFAGFRNQRELSRFYHAADVLVLASRFGETWGLVVNEALHHGVPCVVSDQVGCAPDLIEAGVTGEIFRSDDAAQLAAALGRALRYAGLEQTRTACRERVGRYSVSAAARGIAEAYHAVCGEMQPQ